MADIQRCAPDDPRRCQSTAAHGQCPNLSVENGRTCLIHGGNSTLRKTNENNIYALRSSIWQTRIKNFGEDENLKSLNNEIGVLRLLLEERLKMCDDVGSLILASGPLAELVSKIERLVTSCHKLDTHLGSLVNRQALLSFADKIVGIVAHYVAPTQLEEIGKQIIEALGEVNND